MLRTAPWRGTGGGLAWVSVSRGGNLDSVARFARKVALGLHIRRARLLMQTSHRELEPRQKLALEIGSCAVLSSLGLGLELGQWPGWSALVCIAGYLAWVVIYSEATVQTAIREACRDATPRTGQRRFRSSAPIRTAPAARQDPHRSQTVLASRWLPLAAIPRPEGMPLKWVSRSR